MADDNPYQENQLLQQFIDGNEQAMREFFKRFYPRAYYFALKLTRNEQEAEDQAQEALLALWSAKYEFEHAQLKDIEAFVITVVRNRCLNYMKHEKMKAGKTADIAASIEKTETIIEAQIIQEDIFNRIYREMLELGPKQVELLKMIFVEGLETNEIAERQQTTPNNIRNQKARALEKLRTVIIRKGLDLPTIIFILLFY